MKEKKEHNKAKHPYLFMITEKVVQLAFWVGLGYIVIHYGIPELGDTVAAMYQEFKEYFGNASTEEQTGLGLFGLF